MSSGLDILIVPTILPTGSLHFAEVPNNGKAQDVVDVLLAVEGLKKEVLGDLEDCGWSLQRLRAERSGRPWEENELLALGDGQYFIILFIVNEAHRVLGVVQPSTFIAPIVTNYVQSENLQRHFSTFPMTGHLHTPVLRLVSLNPLLSVMVSFQRVPEIHDGFEYKVFISRTTTVADIVQSIIEELGLSKSLPIPGAGNLEYVIEEVWMDGEDESKHIVPFLVSPLLLWYRNFEASRINVYIRHSWISVFCKPLQVHCKATFPVLRA